MFCQKFGECRMLGNVDVLCGLTLEEKRDGCLLCGFILWKYSLGSFNNVIRPYFFLMIECWYFDSWPEFVMAVSDFCWTLTIPETRARGLVSCLRAVNQSHLDRSLLTVTSVAMSCLLLTVKSVEHTPCTVGWKWLGCSKQFNIQAVRTGPMDVHSFL